MRGNRLTGVAPQSTLDRADAWLRHRSWLADPALALLLAALFAPASIGFIRDGTLTPGWTAALVAAVVVLHAAIAIRHRAPVPVFALVAAAELVLAVSPPLPDGQGTMFAAVLMPSSVGYLVAAYTVSMAAERPWPHVSLLVGMVGAVVAAARFASAPAQAGTDRTFAELAVVLGGFVAAVVATWAVGQFRRLRTAEVAALAERARAAEADREERDRRAAAEERARIARELHDVVAHSLSVMVRQAEAGRYVSASNPAAAATALGTIADTGREALTDMRALLGVLRADGEPARHAPQPTLEDLPDLVERVRASGRTVTLHVEGDPRPLDRAAHLAAYRLVQEALTNVLKHAAPDATTQVVLSWSPRALRLGVTDTGPARHPLQAQAPGGGGLHGMRERIQLAGGHLRADRTASGGFAVEAELPVANPGLRSRA